MKKIVIALVVFIFLIFCFFLYKKNNTDPLPTTTTETSNLYNPVLKNYTSPNAKYIVVTDSTEGGDITTYIKDIAGNKITSVYHSAFVTWSPDSTYVVVHVPTDLSVTGEEERIFYLNIDDTFKDSGLPNGSYAAAISPKNGSVVYALSKVLGGNAGDLYVRKADGKDVLIVGGDDDFFFNLQWSPDGNLIYFSKTKTFNHPLGVENWVVNSDGSNPVLVSK